MKKAIALATVSCSVIAIKTCTPPEVGPGTDAQHAAPAALAKLEALRVAPEGSMDGYDREKFPHWESADVPGATGCDVRDEVLLNYADEIDYTPAGCDIRSGLWVSVYTGQDITDPGQLDVDHLVPLAEAWRSGASSWSAEERTAYANDIDNLVPADRSSNRSKGDQDPGQWRPRFEQCEYAKTWVAIKTDYQLSVDQREKDALADMLGTCAEPRP